MIDGVSPQLKAGFSRLLLVRCMAVRVIALVLLMASVSGCDKVRYFLAAQSWKWSASGMAETRRRGDIVCHALDAYSLKNGKYPFKLEEIRPEFLREIPQPTTGYKEWDYTLLDDGVDYSLQVLASEFGPQLHKTSRRGWQYTDDHGQRDI